MNPIWVIIVLAALFGSLIGLLIGENKRGRPLMGVMLGALLGPLGWLVILFFSDQRRTCLVCGGKILSDEPVCPGCGHEPPPP